MEILRRYAYIERKGCGSSKPETFSSKAGKVICSCHCFILRHTKKKLNSHSFSHSCLQTMWRVTKSDELKGSKQGGIIEIAMRQFNLVL